MQMLMENYTTCWRRELEAEGCMRRGFLLGIIQEHEAWNSLGKEIVGEAIIIRLREKQVNAET